MIKSLQSCGRYREATRDAPWARNAVLLPGAGLRGKKRMPLAPLRKGGSPIGAGTIYWETQPAFSAPQDRSPVLLHLLLSLPSSWNQEAIYPSMQRVPLALRREYTGEGPRGRVGRHPAWASNENNRPAQQKNASMRKVLHMFSGGFCTPFSPSLDLRVRIPDWDGWE